MPARPLRSLHRKRRAGSARATWSALLALGGCSALPGEFNLSPIYRQRLDAAGEPLEVDFLWPLFCWRRTPVGGSDFRLRPLWRVVREGERTEHQFLWPFGRVVSDAEESDARLFPLWTFRSRQNEEGRREVEWAAPYPIPLWPFVAGGSEMLADGTVERYFGIHPLYASLPGYLTYDRVTTVLFPLYLGTRQRALYAHTFLFWLAGFGGRDGTDEAWHRFLPFYAVYRQPGVRKAFALLWPLLTWGSEKLDTDDPVHRFLLWPPYGRQWSDKGTTSGWSVLWPFFQGLRRGDDYYRLDLLWPVFRWLRHDHPDRPFHQWWLWPLVSRTDGRYQKAWVFLWPLVWLRWFDDPVGEQRQTWILPFFWHVHTDRKDGGEDDFVKVWPLFHRDRRHAGAGGGWSLLSPWPWREGNAYGVEELYGFAWTLAKGTSHAKDDHSVNLFGHLWTWRRQQGRTQWSIPFLLSWEGEDRHGGTLRLLNLLPIRTGGGT